MVSHGEENTLLIGDPGVDTFHAEFEIANSSRKTTLRELPGPAQKVKLVVVRDAPTRQTLEVAW